MFLNLPSTSWKNLKSAKKKSFCLNQNELRLMINEESFLCWQLRIATENSSLNCWEKCWEVRIPAVTFRQPDPSWKYYRRSNENLWLTIAIERLNSEIQTHDFSVCNPSHLAPPRSTLRLVSAYCLRPQIPQMHTYKCYIMFYRFFL